MPGMIIQQVFGPWLMKLIYWLVEAKELRQRLCSPICCSRLKSKLGLSRREALSVLTQLAFIHIERRDLASAKCLLEEHYRRLMQIKRASRRNRNKGKVSNLRFRAILCGSRYEYAEMRVLVNEAWSLCTASLPADDVETLILAHDFPAAEWHIPQNAL
jgi:hypothetical protein